MDLPLKLLETFQYITIKSLLKWKTYTTYCPPYIESPFVKLLKESTY